MGIVASGSPRTGDPGAARGAAGDAGGAAERALPRPGSDARAYFARTARVFGVPVDLRLARHAVRAGGLQATSAVPYGELRTYGDVAAAAGRPRAGRAAGHALRVSPIELFVPCHRVVPAGPGFGTYGGHQDRRAFLLRLGGRDLTTRTLFVAYENMWPCLG